MPEGDSPSPPIVAESSDSNSFPRGKQPIIKGGTIHVVL
jgi:hypothetical protein